MTRPSDAVCVSSAWSTPVELICPAWSAACARCIGSKVCRRRGLESVCDVVQSGAPRVIGWGRGDWRRALGTDVVVDRSMRGLCCCVCAVANTSGAEIVRGSCAGCSAAAYGTAMGCRSARGVCRGHRCWRSRSHFRRPCVRTAAPVALRRCDVSPRGLIRFADFEKTHTHDKNKRAIQPVHRTKLGLWPVCWSQQHRRHRTGERTSHLRCGTTTIDRNKP